MGNSKPIDYTILVTYIILLNYKLYYIIFHSPLFLQELQKGEKALLNTHSHPVVETSGSKIPQLVRGFSMERSGLNNRKVNNISI